MKKIILLHIIIFIGFNVFSQSAELKWGSNIEGKSATFINKLLGVDQQGNIYAERKELGNSSWIEKYDSKSNLIFSKEITDPIVDGKPLHYEKLFLINSKIIAFASRFNNTKNKGVKEKVLTAYTFSINGNGEVDNSSIKPIGKVNAINQFYYGRFNYELSEDKSKILIIGTRAYHSSVKKYSLVKKLYACYDKDLNLLWEKDYEYPFTGKNYRNLNTSISNKGQMNTAFSIQKDDELNDFIAYSYNPNWKDLKKYEIKLPNKNTTSAYISSNNTNDIIVSGFYSNIEEKKNVIEGFYLINLNSEFTPLTETLEAIDNNLWENLRCEVVNQNTVLNLKTKGLRHLKVEHVIPNKNGGGYIVAAMSYTDEVKIFGNIMAIKYNPENKIDWMKKIDRCTWGPYRRLDYIASYNSKNDKLNIILNGGPGTDEPVNLISFDASGNQKTTSLFKYSTKKQFNIIFIPENHIIISDTKIIGYGESDFDDIVTKKVQFKFCEINIQ